MAVGNILRNTDVVDAMVESFEDNEDQPLAERLMRAIEAGDAAGGELKQMKSAGVLVVHRESFPFVDLRVDLNSQPLVELRFLWELYQPTADTYVVRAVDPDKAPGNNIASRQRKRPAFAGPSYATLTLRYRSRYAARRKFWFAGVTWPCGTRSISGMTPSAVSRTAKWMSPRHRPMSASSRSLMRKSWALGGAQLEVGLDRADEPAVLTAEPQQGVGQAVGDQFGAGIARAQFEQAALFEGQGRLGNVVSPRRRSFAGQIFKHLDRLGHHGLLLIVRRGSRCCAAQSKYRALRNNDK